jgi:hypothetical protein
MVKKLWAFYCPILVNLRLICNSDHILLLLLDRGSCICNISPMESQRPLESEPPLESRRPLES